MVAASMEMRISRMVTCRGGFGPGCNDGIEIGMGECKQWVICRYFEVLSIHDVSKGNISRLYCRVNKLRQWQERGKLKLARIVFEHTLAKALSMGAVMIKRRGGRKWMKTEAGFWSWRWDVMKIVRKGRGRVNERIWWSNRWQILKSFAFLGLFV